MTDLINYKSNLVQFIPNSLKDASYNEKRQFCFYLCPSYYSSLIFQVQLCDDLINQAIKYYSEGFTKKLKDMLADYIRAYIWYRYIGENYAILGGTFKTYYNDPNGLDWTPENIDAYLWEFYKKTHRDPWTDKEREYTPDWFKGLDEYYNAFMLVWDKFIHSGDSERIKTAVKMSIILATVPDYMD